MTAIFFVMALTDPDQIGAKKLNGQHSIKFFAQMIIANIGLIASFVIVNCSRKFLVYENEQFP